MAKKRSFRGRRPEGTRPPPNPQRVSPVTDRTYPVAPSNAALPALRPALPPFDKLRGHQAQGSLRAGTLRMLGSMVLSIFRRKSTAAIVLRNAKRACFGSPDLSPQHR